MKRRRGSHGICLQPGAAFAFSYFKLHVIAVPNLQLAVTAERPQDAKKCNATGAASLRLGIGGVAWHFFALPNLELAVTCDSVHCFCSLLKFGSCTLLQQMPCDPRRFATVKVVVRRGSHGMFLQFEFEWTCKKVPCGSAHSNRKKDDNLNRLNLFGSWF